MSVTIPYGGPQVHNTLTQEKEQHLTKIWKSQKRPYKSHPWLHGEDKTTLNLLSVDHVQEVDLTKWGVCLLMFSVTCSWKREKLHVILFPLIKTTPFHKNHRRLTKWRTKCSTTNKTLKHILNYYIWLFYSVIAQKKGTYLLILHIVIGWGQSKSYHEWYALGFFKVILLELTSPAGLFTSTVLCWPVEIV